MSAAKPRPAPRVSDYIRHLRGIAPEPKPAHLETNANGVPLPPRVSELIKKQRAAK